MSTRPSRGGVRGVTLIELVVFIVIVGVALAGLFAAFNTITAASADPQVRKQVLAIAESMLDEIALMPFTFCDPNDDNAATATSTAGCLDPNNNEDLAMGTEPPAGEVRYDPPGPRFDNVSDYHGFSMLGGIRDINQVLVNGLDAYSVTNVTITRAGLALGLPLDGDALRISVTVTGPGGVAMTLEGYRTRYAPNALP